MIFRDTTTALEVTQEFNKSVMKLLDDIEEVCERGKYNRVPELTNAVHTRKLINKWFFENGRM